MLEPAAPSDRVIADTCVLIDLQLQNAYALKLRTAYGNHQLELSVTAAAEFMIGFANYPEQGMQVLSAFDIKPITTDTIQLYAKIWNYLRKEGLPIGPNDVWIAATCIEHNVPLLTRNVREFRRIPGLEVLTY